MIYFIRDAGSRLIKIGHAGDVFHRMGQIQVHCPNELLLLAVEAGGAERERGLHKEFAEARFRGEWFAPVPALVAHIDALGPPPQKPSGIYTWGKDRLTTAEVARRAGVSPSLLSRVRNGKCEPTLSTAIKLSKITGLPVEAFAKREAA